MKKKIIMEMDGVMYMDLPKYSWQTSLFSPTENIDRDSFGSDSFEGERQQQLVVSIWACGSLLLGAAGAS